MEHPSPNPNYGIEIHYFPIGNPIRNGDRYRVLEKKKSIIILIQW